jgi:beta-lactamase family protein
VPSAGAVDPAVVQARYDTARDREEAMLRSRSPDRAQLARLRATVLAAERYDNRPAGWHGGRDVPRTPLPRGSMRALAERGTDAVLAGRLAALGRGYPAWAGFWVHDLTTGRTAGWNSDARFPAASTVKLGALVASLRSWRRPELSPDWYDLRQLTGWSSNLAANRLSGRLGYGAVADGMRRLGMWSSTYPGPYRVGTSRLDAPRPPPYNGWRATTAHDLGRALYALHSAAAGNRYQQRRLGLSRARARLALELLLDAYPRGDNAGLVRPFLPGVPIAQKNGWISDTRVTAAIVYASTGPKIVVILVHRPSLPYREAQSLGKRVLTLARIP